LRTLPTADPLQLQREALDLVASFPGGRPGIGPRRQTPLLRVDARCEPIISQLTAQYTANYQRSSRWRRGCGMGCSIWSSVHRGISGGIEGRYAAGEQKRWKTSCAGIGQACATIRPSTASSGCFRYGHWIPAQWREVHELYEFARMRRLAARAACVGAAAFSQPGESLEQQYIRSLLLMRLDSGNFTPIRSSG